MHRNTSYPKLRRKTHRRTQMTFDGTTSILKAVSYRSSEGYTNRQLFQAIVDLRLWSFGVFVGNFVGLLLFLIYFFYASRT